MPTLWRRDRNRNEIKREVRKMDATTIIAIGTTTLGALFALAGIRIVRPVENGGS